MLLFLIDYFDHIEYNSNLIIPFQEIDKLDLNDTERNRLKQHFALIRNELEVDSDELRERNQLTLLDEETKTCEEQLTETEEEYEKLLKDFEELSKSVQEQNAEQEQATNELTALQIRESELDKSALDKVQSLIEQNEKLKQEEQEFKENCRQELSDMQRIIDQEEEKSGSPESNVEELQRELEHELEQLQSLRMQAAKQNRQLTTVQRQLDNIPDRIELAQYQKRFLELYNQVSAKHRETKQFFSLYNTLSQTKTCLDKELSLLNSIFDNYQQLVNIDQSGLLKIINNDFCFFTFQGNGIIACESRIPKAIGDLRGEHWPVEDKAEVAL